ncbi:MAG TPA: hypothetical protein VKH41_11155 [Myxococcota bacterium]|nr:hypothetical protein [Myxococcota bacterium]
MRGRRPQPRRRTSIAVALAQPARAGAYPGYRQPELEHRTRAFLTGAALLHGTVIAVLVALASLAPQVEDRILHLRILKPEPEPPRVVEAVPEPPPPPPPAPKPKPKPVRVEAPKPLPPPPPPRPEPPAPKPRPVVKPEPIAPPEAPPIPASVPAPARIARQAPPRPSSSVQVPAPQIDRMTARLELPEPGPVAAHRTAAPLTARSAPPPMPAAIDRVAVPRPEVAPPAPEVRAPRPAPAPELRAARPAPIAPGPAVGAPRPALRGVALSELLPCVSDARELELKQRTVAAARNLPLCESSAGRFHFIETKNVNAFLMRIEQSAGRRSGDRCEELKLALECIASLPPRSRR